LIFVRGESSFHNFIGFLFMLCLATIANLHFNRAKVVINDERITHRTLMGFTTLKWSEISDVNYSPHLISILSMGQRKRINIFRAEYGISLEPFDVLKKEVTDRTNQRLVHEWEQSKLPISYIYPSLLLGTIMVYMIPLGLILTFFVLLSMGTGGHWFGNYLFLAIGILVLVPLFIRDYLKSHKKLTLNEEGLRQTNGKEKYIPWQTVRRILIKEAALGYGSIIVESEDGKKIWIPRTIMNCGQLVYLIKNKTQLSETYGHEN